MNISVLSRALSSLSASSIVATDSLRGDIESIRFRFFVLLLACTAIVAVGVVMEEVVEHLGNENHAWIVKPEWHHMLARIGWVLVVIGVIGEGIFEGATSSVDNILQDFNNTLLAIATEQAGSASKSAKTARDEAKDAKASAGAAGMSAAKAQDKADVIGRKADELREKSVELAARLAATESAESAELKKELELENSLAPRRISYTIGPGFSTFEELNPFHGTKVMFEVLTDAEARRAAGAIAGILTLAKWDIVSTVPNPDLYTGVNDGVRIEYGLTRTEGHLRVDKQAQKAAEALALYLTEQNWEADPAFGKPNEIPANTVKIIVGFKPNALFEPDWVKQGRERRKQEMEREREFEKRFPQIFNVPPK
jgi:hypothetical protein